MDTGQDVGPDKRLMPEEPGGWYAEFEFPTGQWSEPDIVQVYRAQGHGDRLYIFSDNWIGDRDDIRWICKIPGPDVCLALEECVRAEAEWAAGELSDECLEFAVASAEARLYAATREAAR